MTRAAVFGAAGFIGAHVTARLAESGVHVTALVRSSDVTVRGAATVVVGDVRDPAVVAQAVAGCDVVFALAGRSGAVASVRDPQASLLENEGGMLTLLNAVCALPRIPRIVFPGSRLSYGIVGSLPVREDAPRRPTSPYGLHKTFCEEYLALYRRRHGLRYAVARITNPYGAGALRPELPYNVLGSLAARAVAGEPLTIFGDGSQLRDYLYIDDTVDALMLLAGDVGDEVIVNIGSGDGMRFGDAVTLIAEATHVPVHYRPWPAEDYSVETGDFVADITRARALGFAPKVSFAIGLARMTAALRGERESRT